MQTVIAIVLAKNAVKVFIEENKHLFVFISDQAACTALKMNSFIIGADFSRERAVLYLSSRIT